MATFTTNKPFLSPFPATYGSGISILQLTNTIVDGTEYKRAIQVNYLGTDGKTWRATIGGNADLELVTIDRPPFPPIPIGVKGTLRAYLQEEKLTGDSFETAWSLSKVTVKAEDVYAAIKNPSLIGSLAEKVLKGNDILNLSPFDDPAPSQTDAVVRGFRGNDIMHGGAGNDRLQGDAGKDELWGEAGDDALTGGTGKDNLRGGADADTFIYLSKQDSRKNERNRDLIVDFNAAEGDTIDLSAIDAIPSSAANDAFVFIGSESFSGSSTRGEVRFVTIPGTANGLLEINLAGGANQKIPEMQIELQGVTAFDPVATPQMLVF